MANVCSIVPQLEVYNYMLILILMLKCVSMFAQMAIICKIKQMTRLVSQIVRHIQTGLLIMFK